MNRPLSMPTDAFNDQALHVLEEFRMAPPEWLTEVQRMLRLQPPGRTVLDVLRAKGVLTDAQVSWVHDHIAATTGGGSATDPGPVDATTDDQSQIAASGAVTAAAPTAPATAAPSPTAPTAAAPAEPVTWSFNVQALQALRDHRMAPEEWLVEGERLQRLQPPSTSVLDILRAKGVLTDDQVAWVHDKIQPATTDPAPGSAPATTTSTDSGSSGSSDSFNADALRVLENYRMVPADWLVEVQRLLRLQPDGPNVLGILRAKGVLTDDQVAWVREKIQTEPAAADPQPAAAEPTSPDPADGEPAAPWQRPASAPTANTSGDAGPKRSYDASALRVLEHFNMAHNDWLIEAQRIQRLQSPGPTILDILQQRGVITAEQARWADEKIRSGNVPLPRTRPAAPAQPRPYSAPTPASRVSRAAPPPAWQSSRGHAYADGVPQEWVGVRGALTTMVVALRLGAYSLAVLTIAGQALGALMASLMNAGPSAMLANQGVIMALFMTCAIAGLTFVGGFVTMIVGVGLCMNAPERGGHKKQAKMAFWLLIGASFMQLVALVVAVKNGAAGAAAAGGPSGWFSAAMTPIDLMLGIVVFLMMCGGWLMLVRFLAGIGKVRGDTKIQSSCNALYWVIGSTYLLGVLLQLYRYFEPTGIAGGEGLGMAVMSALGVAAVLGFFWLARTCLAARKSLTITGQAFAAAQLGPRGVAAGAPVMTDPGGTDDEPSFI